MFYLPVNVLAQYMKATMLFCFEINVKMILFVCGTCVYYCNTE